MEDIAKL